MPLPTIPSGNVASATAGGFSVDNSCRFNTGDSAELSISPSSSSNRKTWTLSMWVKRCTLGQYYTLWRANGSGIDDYFSFQNDDTLDWSFNSDGGFISTNRKFRDVGAWFHFVLRMDSTNATAGDRQRLYVNGVEETSFSTDTQVSQDTDGNTNNSAATHRIGASASSQYFDGYIAEVVLLDGISAAPTEFGEFDEDSPTIWKPKDVSGLTFGTNGFYLDFEDSSNLGNNAGSGSADFSESNIVAADQSTDTPTNSFCTINPLDEPYGSVTLSEGNLVQVQTSDYPYNRATMGVANGKWYWEGKITASGGDDVIGIASVAAASSTDYLYKSANNYAYYSHTTNHGAYGNNAAISTTNYDAYTDDDIISVALDLTNNKLYFAKNGTWANSGDPTSGATGTGAVSITAAASTVDGFYFPAACDYGGSPRATWSMNFGSPAHTVSSGNADANGYGNFEFAVPSGYYALCTKNLAEFG